jgi:NitT/TauT family transport system substrate-binding protein
MRTRRMRGMALLVTAVTLVLAAGCSSAGSEAGTPRVEKPDLTVAVVPAVDSSGFFVALHEGLFRAQGLNVKFVPAISSKTVIADQVSGQYDVTCGNYVSYIQAQQSHQANLDIFAEGSTLQPGVVGIYTMPGSPIRTLGELKGRTIAINAPRNILYLLAASALTDHGISPADVHFVTAKNGFPAMPAELRASAFNAAVLAEPFGSVAEEAYGAVPLADFSEGATVSFPVEGYVVTKQWARKYPHTLAAFYKALEEGQELAGTDRAAVEAAMEDLPEPLGLSKETAAIMSLAAYPVSSGPVGSVDKVRLQRLVDVMQQFIGFPAFNIDSMLMGG